MWYAGDEERVVAAGEADGALQVGVQLQVARRTHACKKREREGVSHSNSISRLDVSLKHFPSYDSSTPEFEAYEK